VRERALWRVGPYLRPFTGKIVVVVTTAMVGIAAQLAIPLIAKAVVDGPVNRGETAGILPLGLLAIGLGFVEIALAWLRRRLLTDISTGMETRLRDDLYAHLQRLDVGFHDRWGSGQLLSRATTDIGIIRRFAGFGAIFFVLVGVQVLAIFGLLLRLDPLLGLLTMLGAVPIVFFCRRFVARYHVIVRDIQDQTGDLATTIEESAKGIRVLKAFGRGPEAFDGYRDQCQVLHDTQMSRIRLHTRFVWVLGSIPNVTMAAVLLGGVLAVGNGTLSLGGLVAFVSYLLTLVWPLEALGWILAMAEEAETAAGRLWEVIDTEPVIDDRPGAIELGRARGELRFEGVAFQYPDSDRTPLRGLDLTVSPGETVALVGATGSGKTTLATLLTRLYDPTAGRITLDGHDLRDISVRSLRAQIGFAFEEPSLFSASVRENLLMGKPDASDDELAEALEIAQAQFAFDLPWGLDTRIGEQGLSLSGGQRQRLALARAIVGRPRILVLDDPLSALDVHTEARVEAALRPILAECTALIVVHRPSTVALADRAALLEDGRVVATGLHHDLLASEPRYRAILGQVADEPEGAIT
jgi:ATP-binding cassette subfamily B protein